MKFIKGQLPWNAGLPKEEQPNFGRIAWNIGLTKRSDDRVRKISNSRKGQLSSFKGKHHSEASKQKNREAHLGKKIGSCWNKGLTKETSEAVEKISRSRKGRSSWNKGGKWSEEVKTKMRKPRTTTVNMLGKKRTEDGRRNISLAKKKSFEDSAYKEKVVRQGMRNLLNFLKPNKSELRLFGEVCGLSGDYALNTKGEIMLIGGKIPDIVNVNGKKQVIELFGDYWHGEKRIGRTKEQEENLRKSHFSKYGYDCLIIWGSELKNRETLRNKLQRFISG